MDNVENVENAEQEKWKDGIQDLIKASLDKDYNHANKVFGEVMTIKMSDILDQEKVRMADQVYNGAEEEEEDNPEDDDLADESEDDETDSESEDEDEVEAESEEEDEETEDAAV